jgi:SpoVK/Ycf46/Vps4 family AAA+-type ATPase
MLSINMKTQLLESIECLFEISRNSQLEPGIFKQCSKDIKTVSSYFKTNRLQSILLAVIFVNNCQSESVGLETLGTHLGISPLRLLQESNDIEALTKSGIIRKTERTRSGRKNLLRQYFEINDSVIEAMMDNRPMPDMAPPKPQDAIDLLRSLNTLWGRCERGELRPEELQRGIRGLLEENEKFPLVMAVRDLGMEDLETFLFLMIIWKTLNSNQTTEVQKLIAPILRSSARSIRYMQNLNLSENDLIRKDLAEIVEADFFSDTSLRLTDRAVRIIRECGINLYRDAKKSENIILPESIAEISLVFNSVERERIQMLKSILNEEKLTETRERLARKKQPMGIAILLYGPPGTGKTEAVYQLARETGRDIFKVDISSTKSMWFGESEKIIKKKLFTDYYAYAKKCERLPILFINEADAVISKRKQVGASNVAQTENAIQNIILEELEKFDGILFCTTNLADNLDPAFERRFLFKIELGAPDIKSRKEIWRLKLPGLTLEDLGTLSARFHFSGGQINNIVRKADMYEIINGVDPDLAAIIGFCEEESTGWHDSRQSLGFRLPEAS